MTDPDPEVYEGLCMLLGLSSDDLPSADCKEDGNSPNNQDDDDYATGFHVRSYLPVEKKHAHIAVPEELRKWIDSEHDESIFSNTHCINESSGMMMNKPSSVALVNLSSIGKGNGLMATEKIRRGEVIYTERALYAAQIDPVVQFAPLFYEECVESQDFKTDFSYSVRACQCCFRSLETSSCLLNIATQDNKDTSIPNPNLTKNIPYPNLWPIHDYVPQPILNNEFSDEQENEGFASQHYNFPASIHRCQNCQV